MVGSGSRSLSHTPAGLDRCAIFGPAKPASGARRSRYAAPVLTFCDFPGLVDATNNVSERALRPSVIQRKVTNGYRAKWAADAEADMRTTVDTARLTGANPYNTILGAVSAG